MQPNSSDGEPDPQSESQPQPKSQASEPQEQQDKWFWEHTLYEELRKLAASRLAQEKPGNTLQATALVHEAYLRLVADGPNSQRAWNGRHHFFGAAAEAMRRILIERARRKKSLRDGGEWQRQELKDADLPAPPPDSDLLDVDEALCRLEQTDPLAAEIVKLRYFAGLTIPQIAEILQVSPSTVDRQWAYARAWLNAELSR